MVFHLLWCRKNHYCFLALKKVRARVHHVKTAVFEPTSMDVTCVTVTKVTRDSVVKQFYDVLHK